MSLWLANQDTEDIEEPLITSESTADSGMLTSSIQSSLYIATSEKVVAFSIQGWPRNLKFTIVMY